MLRWVLALVALGFALAPVCGDEPKPLWEIETAADAKRISDVPWIDYSLDGKTLITQVEDSTDGTYKGRLVAWDAATRKQKFSVGLGSGVIPHFGLNTVTKNGTVLVARDKAYEVRSSGRRKVRDRDPGNRPAPLPRATRRAAGGTTRRPASNVWLLKREGERCWEYSHGRNDALV